MFKTIKHLKLIDIILLILFPIIATAISIFIINSYPLSTILFYGVPGIYLSLRFGHLWQEKKGLLFAILVATPFAIIVDYIGIQSGIWYTPQSYFATRFLGVIPWEDFFWMITATYTMVIIYETLLDKGKHELLDRRILYFLLSAAIVLGSFFLLLLLGRSDLLIFDSQYTYLVLGSVFFLFPTVLFVLKFPKFLKRFLPLSAYFLYLTILFEITATHLNQWIFTGIYLLPPLNIFGNAPIAYEELFFVGIIGPMAAIAFYEFFDNGEK